MSVTVVVCNDRPIVREGLERLLNAEPDIEVVGTTDNGMQAIMMARRDHPKVIVTGLTLNSMSGIDLMKRIEKEELDPTPRLLVYATIEDDLVLSDVLRSGASGILADDASREEMVLAIRVVARGQAMLGPGVAERMLAWYREWHVDGDTNLAEPIDDTLTPREREVLLLIAQGLSIPDIAAQLFIGVATVRTHIYRLRCKLRLNDRAQLVSFAYRAGLMRPV